MSPESLLIKPKIKSTGVSFSIAELINLIPIPGVLFRGQKLDGINTAAYKLFTKAQLDLINEDERIVQVIQEVETIGEAIAFDLSLEDMTYHATVSPVENNPGLNLVLFEDISVGVQSERDNALLYRLTLLFTASNQPFRDLLQMAVDQILFELQITGCSIFLFNKKTGLLEQVAWATTDLSEQAIRTPVAFKLGQGIAGHVAQVRKPLVIPDTSKDPRFIPTSKSKKGRSLLCLPLSTADRFIGVLSVSRSNKNTFSDKEMQFFTTIAGRLALYVEADQIKGEERQLNKITRIINSSVITETIQEALNLFADLMQTDRCFALECIDGKAEILASCGMSRLTAKQLEQLQSLVKGESVKKQWILLKKPVLKESHRSHQSEACYGIVYPLVVQGHYFGYVYVQNTKWCRTFTDTELHTGASIVSQIAVALESARFHDEVYDERNRMQQILDSLRDGIILYTLDMRVLAYNQATKKLLGLKKDFSGLKWEEALNLRATKYSAYKLIRHFDAYQFFTQAVHQGKTSTGLATLTTNPPRVLEIATGPVYDRQHKISGVMSHARDITQIHELQTKMANRVKQLTYLFKISSVPGFNVQQIVRKILNLILRLLAVKACQLVLLNPDDNGLYIVESSGNKKLLNEVNAVLLKKMESVVRKQKTQTTKVSIGSEGRNAFALITPIRGQYAACVGALVVIDKEDKQNFSEEDANLLSIAASRIAIKLDNAWLLKQVERDRERLETIIEQSVDGILVTDKEDRIKIWNPALERLTGISESDVKNRTIEQVRQLIPTKDRNPDDQVTEVMIQNHETGKSLWLGIAYAPMRTNKEVTGHVAIVRDISRQKELEQAKNEFVSTASHELRSPLTAIVGYLSMLKRGDAGRIIDQQQSFFVDKAYQNAKRMVTLVEDLLTTTRVESGQLRYQIEPVNLLDIIESVTSDARFRAEEKSITVSINTKGVTPVFADHDSIHQVVSNLINNAIKYTPNKGKVTISFRQVTEDGKPMLVTAVQDSGVGIEAADQNKIFDKFARVDNPLSVNAGGAGLGLYITKSIIEHLGGKIWLESQKGKGSTFYFSLPVAHRSGKERMRG